MYAMTTGVAELDPISDLFDSADAIEYSWEQYSRGQEDYQPESFLTQHEIDDAETERLLGRPLPEARNVPQAYERKLLGQIQEGDEQAMLDYLVVRARTIYTVVSDIPQMNGLTIEDYFQIGCATVIDFATKPGDPKSLKSDPAAYLNGAINGAVQGEIKAQQLAPSEAQLVPVSEDNSGVEPDKHLEQLVEKIESQVLHRVLEKLNYRGRAILTLRCGLGGNQPQTLEAVGRQFDITRERVRQIEKQVLRKLDKTIPEGHFLRIPLVDGVPDQQETYAARRAQEEAARMVQLQRERQAAEEFLLSSYRGDPEAATRQEKLIGGLAGIAIKVLRAKES